MAWFGVGGVLYLIGLAIIVASFVMLMRVTFRYRLYSSFHFLDGVKKLFSEEGKSDRIFALMCVGAMGVGMCVLFPSILAGDSIRNQPCLDACGAEGWRRGRFRRSPHDIVGGVSQGPIQCWCNNSEDDWGLEPLDVVRPN